MTDEELAWERLRAAVLRAQIEHSERGYHTRETLAEVDRRQQEFAAACEPAGVVQEAA